MSTKSTEEIRRLEDSLLAAAVAAEHTIKVRRHMKKGAPEERERPIRINEAADAMSQADFRTQKSSDESGAAEKSDRADTHVREFKDIMGRPWRAWPVIPGLTRASASGRRFLGDFQDGWICFEGADNTARRRLPRREASWASVTEEELQQLLAEAIDAPGRETQQKDKH